MEPTDDAKTLSEDAFALDATLIDPDLEAEMRTIWGELPDGGDIDPALTIKVEAPRPAERRAPAGGGDDGRLAGVCVLPAAGADLDATVVETGELDVTVAEGELPECDTATLADSVTASGSGAAPSSPSASATGFSSFGSSSTRTSTSASGASSVFSYKEDKTVVLRASEISGLDGEGGEGAAEPVVPGGDSGCDFIVKKRIGKGGMGVVYLARQMSMNRDVALKMILPTAKHKAGLANRLIAEALVTGDLEHPGIVPVHELGHTTDDRLFYAMKVVQGEQWSKTYPKKSERENIDILLRVADAVAFAHDKGVLHRDIKPENVMLGGFGEVLLMDWGLAVSLDARSKAETIAAGNAKAGTPAYMAPEMALGRADRIGPASDIYLLGATLFEILTGVKPHYGPNVYICLASAAENVIRETDRDDKLMEVARRAMAKDPADRYGTVKEFQKALAEVMDNLESVRLSNNARETLAAAERDGDYEGFSQAVFAFREAARLWPGNDDASAGEAEARRRYAACAYAKGDYDLALSCLSRLDDAESRALALRIEKARRGEANRKRLIKVLAAAVLLVVVAAAGIVHRQARLEREALDLAEQKEEERRKEVELQSKFSTAVDFIRNYDFTVVEKKKRELLGELVELRKILRDQARLGADYVPGKKAEERIAALLAEAEAVRAAADWGFDEGEARRRQAAAAAELGQPAGREIVFGEGVGVAAKFTLIPAGHFVMGRLKGYTETGDYDEYPHRAVLTQPFYLGETVVTRGLWRAVVGIEDRDVLEQFLYSEVFEDIMSEEEFNAREWSEWGWRTLPLEPGDEELPCTGVSWDDIEEIFLPAARKYVPEGWILTLPSEAQWEYACRAGGADQFANGKPPEELGEMAWTSENSEGRLRPVALLKPNAWGLYDMHGGVKEILYDSYDASFYMEAPVEDPECHTDIYFKALRGGGYNDPAAQCTSSFRAWVYWEGRLVDGGFRLMLVENSWWTRPELRPVGINPDL